MVAMQPQHDKNEEGKVYKKNINSVVSQSLCCAGRQRGRWRGVFIKSPHKLMIFLILRITTLSSRQSEEADALHVYREVRKEGKFGLG